MSKIFLTKEMISMLKHVATDQLTSGKYNFPDFMIIGPQRTGTTWLQQNLINHPQIFMPPEKELFFFSNLIVNGTNKNYSSDRLEWYSKQFATNSVYLITHFIKENIKTLINRKNFSGLLARTMKYFGEDLVKGEATASYAAMDESMIREVITLRPDIKIIMFVRHPYDRAWSHAKKDLAREKKRKLEDVSIDEFRNFFLSDYQVRCGLYTGLMDTWRKYVKDGNLFIGFFDDIRKDPGEILKKVFVFLGVPAGDEYIEKQISTSVINPTVNTPIPEEHKKILKMLFSEEINRLNAMFGLEWEAD